MMFFRQADVEVRVERLGDFVAGKRADAFADDSLDNLANEVAECDGVIAVLGSGFPLRLVSGECRSHRIPIIEGFSRKNRLGDAKHDQLSHLVKHLREYQIVVVSGWSQYNDDFSILMGCAAPGDDEAAKVYFLGKSVSSMEGNRVQFVEPNSRQITAFEPHQAGGVRVHVHHGGMA